MKEILPPKPADSNWTDAQWEAINRGRQNILVAAGAGSGKTRVLVERIIKRLLDEEHPLEIDRLLVVTFTNAAAAEMRQRIGRALEEAIKKNPAATRLRRQMLLLNRAPITTLHSFCREILRQYYYLRDLDPSCRILDETEGDLLRQDLVEEVLEAYYEQQQEDSGPFYRLVEAFSTDRGDEGLQKLLHVLYSFSRSHPWPQAWLEAQAAAFSLPQGGLAASSWLHEVQAGCVLELKGCGELLQRARQLALSPGGPAPYIQNLAAEIHMLHQAEEAAAVSWKDLADNLQKLRFDSLKPCRGQDYDKSLAATVRELRNGAKKTVQALQTQYFQRPLDEQEADIRELKPVIDILVALVDSFSEKYRQAKEERNVLDFSDLEHHALSILTDDGSGPDRMIPSKAALYYRQRFQEVLVDEYQDTNEVQEAILRLLSRPREEGGNLFMVGDVKQSIYRFRLAEPGLFLNKYTEYKTAVGRGLCIDLSRNFRSRREILSAVNYVFRQIMDKAVGEIDYVNEAALAYGASYPVASPPPPPEAEGEGGGPIQGNGTEPGKGFSEKGQHAVEVLLISRNPKEEGEEEGETGAGVRDGKIKVAAGEVGSGDGSGMDDGLQEMGEEEGGQEALALEAELERAALEGRLIAAKIKELMGCHPSTAPVQGHESGPVPKSPAPTLIFDKGLKEWRPLAYRDIVILLRSTENWAPPLLEELQGAGIPAYAELGSGYFQAVEVEVMLSLLKVIDNPYQDIPLAAVLRSPLVGLNGEDLALIRTAAPREAFYEALKGFCQPPEDEHPDPGGRGEGVKERARGFLARLRKWQRFSREGALAELIWQIYGETGYYDLVGGMPGGGQRQANLRALYDRARQYESTSFRGLLRFLRFVEKLRERGGDLGAARALGEQEDVVRVITIHKSKGLEFPVVFLAGLAKQFNQQDLRGDFLLHKDVGFGPRFLDAELKVSYPTLPYLAVQKRLKLELLAEEMRVLYVALTRAEEKLYLVASVNDIGREAVKWAMALPGDQSLRLPARSRSAARSALDWLGPALLRHPHAYALRELAGMTGLEPFHDRDESQWSFSLCSAAQAAAAAKEGQRRGQPDDNHEGLDVQKILSDVASLTPLSLGKGGAAVDPEVSRRLSWQYPFRRSATHLAKQSVSELKKRRQQEEEEEVLFARGAQGQLPGRPRFLEQEKLTATERGTAYHAVLQYLDLQGPLDEAGIMDQIKGMVSGQKITPAEQEAVGAGDLASFFAGPLGQRLLSSQEVRRELAFSLALPAAELYDDWDRGVPGRGEDDKIGDGAREGGNNDTKGVRNGEKVLLQGVIDCLFREEKGLILLDFKTDRTGGLAEGDLKRRYREQLNIYSRAVEDIWQEEVVERYLYFFDGGLSISV